MSAAALPPSRRSHGRRGTSGARFFVQAHDTAWRNAHNFSGGPGALPRSVLGQLAQAIEEVPEVGLSLLGISHRSDWFQAVTREAEATIRTLLGLQERDWVVLFLQGGASLQFTMALANLGCAQSTPVDWVRAGYWSAQAMREASVGCSPRLLWDGQPRGYRDLPGWQELGREARILHYVSNETVEGLAFAEAPPRHDDQLIVCDMSSDFLSRPVDLDRHDLVYAHAQKNLGPAGVTVVLLRRRLLESVPEGLAPMLDYRVHAAAGSIYNTPPVVAIYTMLLVLRWLRAEIGGLDRMAERNAAKAACVYDALEARPDLYTLQAHAAARSPMNVAFHLVEGTLLPAFHAAAGRAGFSGLGGHRSLGGLRASLYNAVERQAADHLAEFLATGWRA